MPVNVNAGKCQHWSMSMLVHAQSCSMSRLACGSFVEAALPAHGTRIATDAAQASAHCSVVVSSQSRGRAWRAPGSAASFAEDWSCPLW